ncbi:biotin-independent malonate decarboxylase subunit beta [Bradyrhizobium diazoefficiens]|uniref:Putative malonate decarboxylase beta subunit n=1 Tax=Bradyrhizobium diazoefficiens SEMIA 5080 TaxID=754504 RepID=A0A837C988_9BRAD|nr:biotin-independent malonate decarboxylase subunit beta [Bradyrhizobium diazoefficiens]APO49890.1 biotin-independent malonate decarboxylase subunit beta [Bradyrhizobium diazoefficiens]KGJ65732.1 putative malonate decarboxylase beta subunit [Bradyrhizobium diazoefficiens SEMIA 5080]KOY07388.1 malonate decarboxylase subunit beta [Bradyrhizobium diazoefficiens]MCD9295817.1 biotin-independent malonate decarboxylase subunit beta [Bradyrhizobium diazoefficiens]MCD9810326.1 biotin-independent malon
MTQAAANTISLSWYEASARQRIDALVDAGSFSEYIGPELREISPHLSIFDLPEQFDDGIVIGRGRLEGSPVLVAAQEGRFMGGAFGEVHGAKLTGLLHAARALRQDVLILFDTGGVRLQEANAGELAIAEIMRAVIELRRAGASVVGLIGGRAGCYGGGSLIAGTCSRLIVSEQGRISVSGPEVIETNRGIEEFDSRDRALVWRTMGGKHRYLIGGADMFVDDEALAFREAAIDALKIKRGCDTSALAAEQERLERRLQRFGEAEDAVEIWQALGIDAPTEIPALPTDAFLHAADTRENADDAR